MLRITVKNTKHFLPVLLLQKNRFPTVYRFMFLLILDGPTDGQTDRQTCVPLWVGRLNAYRYGLVAELHLLYIASTSHWLSSSSLSVRSKKLIQKLWPLHFAGNFLQSQTFLILQTRTAETIRDHEYDSRGSDCDILSATGKIQFNAMYRV